MLLVRPLLLTGLLSFASASPAGPLEERQVSAASTCQTISRNISNASDVIYASASNFTSDIHHWYNTSTQIPACILEAGSAQDVGKAMQIISQTKTPFAVRSGGHASNPGFSSTTGVQISFQRMQQVTLSPDKSTVEIGMGLTWASVYSTLSSSGVNVVGGRTIGPGVGGFTLGGGYSWKTNQYGLTCDTVKSFTLVLPNGTITKVDSTQPDLDFALRGGLNRFGVVTSAEYYTHPQPPLVYTGLVVYAANQTAAILNATTDFFKTNTDPKAQIITTLNGGSTGTSASVLYFYDGATEPDSFKPFDEIPSTINLVKAQSFSSFVSSIDSNLVSNARGTFHTLSTSALTPSFVNAVKNQTDYYGSISARHSGTSVAYDLEPFLATYGQYATDSAFPHQGSPLPLNLDFAWTDPGQDAFWYAAMKASVELLKSVARAEGIYRDDFTAYPNYAITGTTSPQLYGSANAARLAAIRQSVDPANVMGLTGGFAV